MGGGQVGRINEKRILAHIKPLIQKLSNIKIKVYMLHTTSFSFQRKPRPQPASLAKVLPATSDLDFIKYKKWPFLQEMFEPEYLRNKKSQKIPTIVPEKKTFSEMLIFIFSIQYILRNPVMTFSKIKISKLCV